MDWIANDLNAILRRAALPPEWVENPRAHAELKSPRPIQRDNQPRLSSRGSLPDFSHTITVAVLGGGGPTGSGTIASMMAFDLQPHLAGELVELRPMRAEDWEELYAVAADPLIWEGHPARDRYRKERFREYFDEGVESGGALVAMDRKTGKIIGASRYFWYEGRELEIGWTFLARSYWGGVYNGEMKRLMLDHAFRFVDHVIFLVGTENVRSMGAMKKIGGVLTERRVQRSLHGRSSEFVIFEIRKPG